MWFIHYLFFLVFGQFHIWFVTSKKRLKSACSNNYYLIVYRFSLLWCSCFFYDIPLNYNCSCSPCYTMPTSSSAKIFISIACSVGLWSLQGQQWWFPLPPLPRGSWGRRDWGEGRGCILLSIRPNILCLIFPKLSVPMLYSNVPYTTEIMHPT
jgi:hypothetical protein